jgi:hypothetical protein
MQGGMLYGKRHKKQGFSRIFLEFFFKAVYSDGGLMFFYQ